MQTTAGGSTPEWLVSPSISYASGAGVGSATLGAAGDATGAVRAAFNVARTIGAVWDWVQPKTSQVIPLLPVVFNAASAGATTGYSPASASAASMTVGGAASTNDDAWDDAVIAKTYGRHVLASVAALSPGPADGRFDAVSDRQNAFAEAFGLYLWSAATGGVLAIDGKSSSTASLYDLESPAISVPRGEDVAGCVAGALHDLLDPANEPTDAVDGGLAPGRALAVVDSFVVAPNAGTFRDAWITAGHDAAAITRVFIANGALADDGFEPNDSVTETATVGAAGFTPKTLVLNRFNEDWFSVDLPSAAAALAADAKYDQLDPGAAIVLEIRDAAGALLATGAPVPSSGAIHAQTGSVAAGTYKVRLGHVSGATVPACSFQVYVPLTMSAAPIRDWTAGRPYDAALGVEGGIAPYTLSITSGALPPGLGLNPQTQHATGTPGTAGEFSLTLQLRDAGNPANVLQRSQTVTIHEAFAIPVAAFVGFPAEKSIDSTLPTRGGTPPITLSVPSGTLPGGLSLEPGTFRVTGIASSQPARAFTLDGVDAAASHDDVVTRAVVASALTGTNVPAELADGDDACGWWFDAVVGSTVTFSAKTSKGRTKRVLAGSVLAPDRSLVASALIKSKPGSLGVTKLVCPASGRYFVIAASASGDATQLLGSVAISLPKKGKVSLSGFGPSDTTTIEIGAVDGAAVTLKFNGDKKAGLTAKVIGLIDPSGTAKAFAQFVTPSGLGGTFTSTFATGGTWRVVLEATSVSGTPGKLTASYVVKQPKGSVYAAD